MPLKGPHPNTSERKSDGHFNRQGSIRRVLHSPEASNSILGVSAKMIDRFKSENSISPSQSFLPYFHEYCLISEFNMVGKRYIPGLYVMPSAKSPFLWFGVLFVRSGVYQGAMLRFNLYISEGFPDSHTPNVVFETPVFHPSIDEDTLELNVKSAFPEWRRDVNHLWQVLQYTYSVFHKMESKAPLNKLAAHLYQTDQDEFMRRVNFCILKSKELIYECNNDDENYIRFEKFDEAVHGAALNKILTPPKKKELPSPRQWGVSWVEKGSLAPLSRSPS